MRRVCVGVAALVGAALPASAQESQFSALVARGAPDCVPMAVIKALADTVEKLDANQFQFVRSIYAVIPPVSPHLPPGDSAWLASSGEERMLGLSGAAMVDGKERGDVSCARFLAPKRIINLLGEVVTGAAGQGDPM